MYIKNIHGVVWVHKIGQLLKPQMGEGAGEDIISNMWCSSARGNVCVFQQDEQPCFHNNKKHPKVHGEIHTFGV